MFCPNCLYEYEKSVKKCSDCGAELIDQLPETDIGEPDIETATLTDVDNDIEADAIRGMLEDKGIYSFLKTHTLPNSGILLAGMFGKLKYGTIVINKEDLKKAKEVLEDYRKSL